MTETTTKTKPIFTDGVKVEHTVIAPKDETLVTRHISSEMVGQEMASRIMGKILLDVDDLYDPKTGRFLTEDELKAKGAIFLTVDFHKVLTFETQDTVKKGRTTKNPIPFILKEFSLQMIANINWGKYVEKRSQLREKGLKWTPSPTRANGVVNFENCKAIGQTSKGFFTINGVLFKTLKNVTYKDENGVEYTDIDGLKNEYFKKTVEQEQKGKQREADKHGIELKYDPQYRTPRIDNLKSVRCFGFDFRPTENRANKI